MSELSTSGSALLAAAAKAVELYALKHPRPPHVTQQQAAVMLGLHRHTISKFIDSGKLRLNRCGLIPTDQVDALLMVD
jgi:excisionase family DNA binding protein